MASPEPHTFSHKLLAALPTSGCASAFHRTRRDSFPMPAPAPFALAARHHLSRSRGDVPRPRSSPLVSDLANPIPPLPLVACLSGAPLAPRRHRRRERPLTLSAPSLCVFVFGQANWVLQRTWPSLRSGPRR